MTTTTTPTTTPTTHSLVAGQEVVGTAGTTHAFDPRTNRPLEPGFSLFSPDQVRLATVEAAEAFDSYREVAPAARAEFLEDIAARIEAVKGAIVARAVSETGLEMPRLEGELARTTGQLRLFAAVVRQGDHLGVRLDPAIPDRPSLPRVDIRQRHVPLGPVVVFGASNFPLAFSTAGGDTASALAAGCPVIVKAHNAHPGTAALVGRAVTEAVDAAGFHPGTFSLVFGPGASTGQALVADPAVAAVAFTGSRAAGTELMRVAAARPVPIPVYAEMSSVNPVIVLPGALADGASALAAGYVTSLTGSSGQLCTAPGLVFVPEGDPGDRFLGAVSSSLAPVEGQTMLTAGIANAWLTGASRLAGQEGVTQVACGAPGATANAPAAAVYAVRSAEFRRNPVLHEEVFGAASLVVRYASADELHAILELLEGQLTATLHLGEGDRETAATILPVLERKAGRILVGGWPTGVEVGHAMVHGGPFPATSDSRTTSVGSLAIERFLRPVAYQNLPQELLPAPLRDDNPWRLTRRLDGRLEAGAESSQEPLGPSARR